MRTGFISNYNISHLSTPQKTRKQGIIQNKNYFNLRFNNYPNDKVECRHFQAISTWKLLNLYSSHNLFQKAKLKCPLK